MRNFALVYLPLAAAGLLVATVLASAPVGTLLSPELPAEVKSAALQAWLRSWGPLAPLTYVLFVTAEVVVAPIPGAFLYAPGGICFGGFWGGLLSLIGNTIGAGIACGLMRHLGYSRVRRLLNDDWQRYQIRLGERGFWYVLLLRLNPLTSSDMVSYAAGLTTVSLWRVMMATMLGLAPLCFAQSYLAAELFTVFPRLLLPLFGVGLLYVAVVLLVIFRLRQSVPVKE